MISLDDDLCERANRLAGRLGKGLSEFIADAVRQQLDAYGDDAITAQLDAVYANVKLDDEDRAWLELGSATVRKQNP